jgi:hypothetical protein
MHEHTSEKQQYIISPKQLYVAGVRETHTAESFERYFGEFGTVAKVIYDFKIDFKIPVVEYLYFIFYRKSAILHNRCVKKLKTIDFIL